MGGVNGIYTVSAKEETWRVGYDLGVSSLKLSLSSIRY
jgi:hypothetical protein